ncbi:hypothetical protein ACTMTJ_05520 [Phytohabitans sp. LJ34]|uniref:hypothetical protein n=1 Tax=Phytohabitans sp. LJ34 TaxID=3452217 RepID=UPI003F89CB14
MDDIEHLVRVTLTDRAAAVGEPAGLAHAVRGRARQARLRVQAAGAAVAAAAVLLAVPAATRLWSPESGSTVDVVAASAPAAVAAAPPFPFTPTVPLPSYGEPIAELSAGEPGLRYRGGDPERWLTVSVTRERPAPSAPKSYGAAVRERKAALEVGPDGSTLTWQEADGRWLRVAADPHLSRDDLTGYAAGLAPGAVPVRWPFTFETVPPGIVPDVVNLAAVSFRPEGNPPSHGFAGNLTVLLSDTAEVTPSGRPIAVGTRAGWVTASALSVDLGDGRTLVVQSEIGLAEAELVAFAAGIHPTPDALVGRG